jgi:hypothetical protein
VEPGQPGVHRRGPGNAHAVHPVGVHRLQRRGARRDDAAAPQLGRPLRQGDRAARADGRLGDPARHHHARRRAGVLPDRPRQFALRPDLVMAGRTLLGAAPRAGSSSRTTTSAASRSASRRASPRSSTSCTSSACRS